VNDLGTDEYAQGRSSAAADATVTAIRDAGGRAAANYDSVADPAGCAAAVQTAIDEFGQLDILVNNSGVYAFSAIEDVSEDEYRRQFDVNVLGPLLTTKAAVPHLKDGASVINISSNITSVLVPQSAIYSGTKGALDAVTGVLANELAPRGIRVNAILPGYTETEGTGNAGISGTEFVDQLVAQTPLARAGTPDDIAKVAVFLASNDSGWLTGERIAASGGMR
jgi:3-oxoacyl-[acyl-carrier protein] reductase